MTKATKCPVCSTTAAVGTSNRASLQRMAEALGHPLPARFEHTEQALAKCGHCRLEFAVPMNAPGADLYRWLVECGFRYPNDRWEWKVYKRRLEERRTTASADLVVIDFGSGDGRFILQIANISGVHAVGLEQNPDMVARCRAANLDVVEGGLEQVWHRWSEGVDAITFWHVIEHVENPVELLQAARDRLRIQGELCFSVPLTPMSYEHSWPDPFNEPPHHLTRWSLPALNALAARLDMKMELTLPRASPLPWRVLRALNLQANPGLNTKGRVWKSLRLLTFLLRHPSALHREVVEQIRHPQHNGKTLPDLVLVTLRR
jgi:SAM-dependent methyltransferase